MAGQYASAGDEDNDDEIRNEGSDDADDEDWSGCGKICSASKRARGCGGNKDDNDDGTDEDEDDDNEDEDNDAVVDDTGGGNGAVCVRCRMKSAAM